ncbi:bZIP transcription factor [Saxophila tyrrhenica]|uniref:BZIP transcription factor n=1 Tax=Saxophila tyrrhenica TaxID=1690608 RepID=A0AAV9PKF6_9PEZI|nr:bZIP transcription factor [Saxophila tyrrhenica]
MVGSFGRFSPHDELSDLFGPSSGEFQAMSASPNSMFDDERAPDRRDSGYTPPTSGQDSKELARQHKRKEQNRTAQRLYRERKVQRITDLEEDIKRLQGKLSVLQEDNRKLKLEVCRIRTENDVFRNKMSSGQQIDGLSGKPDSAAKQGQPRKGIMLKDVLTVYGGLYQEGLR